MKLSLFIVQGQTCFLYDFLIQKRGDLHQHLLQVFLHLSQVPSLEHLPWKNFLIHFLVGQISLQATVVVVVVAGVVVVVVGFSQQSADEGNMDPIQLSFPQVRSPAHS